MQLQSAESRFLVRVVIFIHFVAFASNAFLDKENKPERSRRDSQSTHKGSPEELRRALERPGGINVDASTIPRELQARPWASKRPPGVL